MQLDSESSKVMVMSNVVYDTNAMSELHCTSGEQADRYMLIIWRCVLFR